MFDAFDEIFESIEEEQPATKPVPVAASEVPETFPIYREAEPSSEPVLPPATALELVAEAQLGITRRQQHNACVLARQLYLNGRVIDAANILSLWPKYEPTADKTVMQKGGPAPDLDVLIKYCESNSFEVKMARIGVYLKSDELNSKQIAFLDMVLDSSSKMGVQAIKNKLKISPIEYQSWLANPKFKNRLKKTGETAISNAVPLSYIKMARKMEDGDLAFIKFGFEVTGEYNPNDRKQVDAQALIRVIFEVLEEEIKDPHILKRIGAKVQLRGAGGSVVQGELNE